MFGRHPYALPLMGGALLAAGIAGVQLGQSAIAGINPIHFQGAAPPPRGVEPGPARPPQPGFAEAYGWDRGNAERAAACDGCATFPVYETYAFAETEAEPRLAAQAWRDPTPLTDPEPWAPGVVAVHRGGEVMRYADFPIEEKPLAEAEAPEEPKPLYDEE